MEGKEAGKVCLASQHTQVPIQDTPLYTDIAKEVWTTPDTAGRLRLDDP